MSTIILFEYALRNSKEIFFILSKSKVIKYKVLRIKNKVFIINKYILKTINDCIFSLPQNYVK